MWQTITPKFNNARHVGYYNRQLSRPFVLLKVVQGMLSFFTIASAGFFSLSPAMLSTLHIRMRAYALCPSFRLTGKTSDRNLVNFLMLEFKKNLYSKGIKMVFVICQEKVVVVFFVFFKAPVLIMITQILPVRP